MKTMRRGGDRQTHNENHPVVRDVTTKHDGVEGCLARGQTADLCGHDNTYTTGWSRALDCGRGKEAGIKRGVQLHGSQRTTVTTCVTRKCTRTANRKPV